MGAITGFYSTHHNSNEMKLIVDKMLESLSHRAAFFTSEYSFIPACFGARFHTASHQKQTIACDESKKIFAAIDGDIFKFSKTDEASVHHFSDAETIISLYQKYGIDFVEKIDGTYAISIWDGKKNQLLLVRDRVGLKPLFYTKQNDSFVFASEIKAILKSGVYQKKANKYAVDDFLSYWYVPNPGTLFESIYQVKPGHVLIFKDGNIQEKTYWKFQYDHTGASKDEAYYKEQFKDVFFTAVSRRLKKYPDAGAFLSGGLDSSSVAAAMHKIKNSAFKVFSGGFPEKEYNEIGDAKVVADHLGLEHLTTIIQFGDDFPELLKKLVYFHDSPFSDTSAIPSYFASKLAKENVDVVLTGDFPDQTLAGSGHYIKALNFKAKESLLNNFFQLPLWNSIVRKLPLSSGSTTFFDKLQRKIYRETFPIEEQRIITNMPVPEIMKPCLYTKEFLKINKKNDPLSFARSVHNEVKEYELLDRMLYFDTISYATDDLMIKVERMTSANGLIAISPFHDIDFVNFVSTLPAQYKIHNMEQKYIMKKAMAPMLPDHTLKKKKKGFDMPIEDWLIQKNPDFVRDLLFDSKTMNRGYFNKTFMHKLVNNFIAQKTDYASGSAATIISLITLELWHRLFVDE